jgi:hypothetical protein
VTAAGIENAQARPRRGKGGQMTISAENRAHFEGLGTAEVRHELGIGYGRYLSGEQRVQAQEWLAEQDASFKREEISAKRRDNRRFIAGIIVGALGALVTIIAAWSVIKVWLR